MEKQRALNWTRLLGSVTDSQTNEFNSERDWRALLDEMLLTHHSSLAAGMDPRHGECLPQVRQEIRPSLVHYL